MTIARRDGARVLVLEDAASRLDAGLPLDQQTHGETAVASLRRQVDLAEWEWLAATASESAGQLPTTLRNLAARRRARGELLMGLLRVCAYPILVLTMAVLVLVLLTVLGMPVPRGLVWLAAAVLLAAAVAGLWLRRRLSDPAFDPRGWGWLGRFSHSLGELPYLAALRQLYAAGVPLRTAQRGAAAAARVPWVRARLTAVAADLERGEGFTAALAKRGALGDESLRLLHSGEAAGQLEDALARAATRRQEVVARTSGVLARALGFAIYLAAAGTVAWIALSFYGGLYGSLLRR